MAVLYSTVQYSTVQYSTSLTAEWLGTSPPNTGVEGSNPRGLKFSNQRVYVGGWIYPEYSVAWLVPVVGFDS